MTRNLILGAFLSSLVVLAAALSFVWTPYDHAALNIPAKLQTPNLSHWFGTDHFGRDMFSMIMVGARTSIAVALVAVGIGMTVGVPLGLTAAARKGSWLDEFIMRGNDLRLRCGRSKGLNTAQGNIKVRSTGRARMCR